MKLSPRQSTGARYLARLSQRYSFLTLPMSAAQYSLPLQAVFQPLKLRSELPILREALARQSDHSTGSDRTAFVPPSPPLEATNGADALRQSAHRRIVILGGPGMGKTTLLKDLLRQAIERAQSDASAPLPLFISLPDLARSGLTLSSYLPAILAELAVDADYAVVLAEAIAAGKAFLCLDSLDEVMPALRPDMIALINREALRSGGTWIIGSRFTEYKGGQFAHSRFDEWELQPLDEARQLTLVEHLLPLFAPAPAGKSNDNPVDTKGGQEKAALAARALLNMLRQNEKTASWGAIPLLLSLVTAIYARTGALSSSRAELYREVVNALLSMRIADEKERAELRLQLADIALLLYQSKGRNFTVQELQTKEENREQVYTNVASMLDSGVLDVVAYQSYSFKHQMFQEYLAALALARQLCSTDQIERQAAWDFAWSKRTYSRWGEILRLLVSILVQEYALKGRDVAAHWLHALAVVRKQAEGDVGNLCLRLALQSLSEFPFSEQESGMAALAAELVVVWVEILIEASRNYADPRRERLYQLASNVRLLNEQAVKAGVDLLVSVLLNPGEESEVRCGAARALGKLGKYAPVHVLFACLRTDHFALGWNIKSALEALGNQFSLPLVETVLRDKNENWQVREQAALMLGRRGGPEVVEVLVETINEEEFDVIYRAAINALGMLGKDAPLPALIACLREGGTKSADAAEALGETGQRDAMEPLIEALYDQNEYVRSATADALVKLPIAMPYEQLLTWLVAENRYLQRVALEKLVQLNQPVPTEPLIAILNNWSEGTIHKNALCLLNRQGNRVPVPILLHLLNGNNIHFRHELKQAFFLLGSDAPINSLFEAVKHGRDELPFEILGMLHAYVPVEPMLALYYEREHIDADWALALINFGERIPAEELITIAYNCTGRRDAEYGDELAVALGSLGPYIVDALLTKLYDYGLLDYGILAKVVRIVYEHIPEDRLLAALKKSEGDLCAGIRILGVAGDDHALGLLLSLLEGQTILNAVHYNVLLALCNFGAKVPIAKVPIAIVLAALQNEEYFVREAALSLMRVLQSAIDMSALVEPLKAIVMAQKSDVEPAPGICVDAIEALGLCGEHAPIAFLTDLLQYAALNDETNDRIHIQAAETLGEAGHYVPLELFYTMLGNEENYEVRDAAIQGMSKHKEQVQVERLLVLMNADDDVDASVVDMLRELGDGASNEVLTVLSQHNDEKVREGASKVLAIRAETPQLEVSTERWVVGIEVPHYVIETLAKLGEEAPFDLLFAALDDEHHYGIKDGAIRILEELARTVPAKILAMASEHDRPGMRRVQLRAWSMLGKDAPIESMIAALSDQNFEVRQLAVEVLGEMGDPAAIGPLTQLLWDEDGGRLFIPVINALSMLDAAVPVEPLLRRCGYREYESFRYLSDVVPDPAVEAAQALKRIHPEAFGEIIPLAEAIVRGELPTGVFAARTQSRLVDAIGEIGRTEPALLDILAEALDWPYWQVRLKAAEALGKIRRNLPDPLIRHLMELRHDPQSPAVREAADNALAEILSLENSMEDE